MHNIYSLEQTSSTMDEGRNLIDSSKPIPAIILSKTQTKGRGRVGKKWISSEAGNLYLSIVIKNIDISLISNFALMLPVCVARALNIYQSSNLRFKWPNDIMYNDKKIGGILLEGYKGHIIIGIGINFNVVPDVQDIQATCLLQENIIDQPVSFEQLQSVAKNICNQITNDLPKIQQQHNYFIEEWRQKQWRNNGEKIKFKVRQQILDCKYLGVNENGEIIIML